MEEATLDVGGPGTDAPPARVLHRSGQPGRALVRVQGVRVGDEVVVEHGEASVLADVSVDPRTRGTRDAEFAAFMVEAEPLLARTAWLLCGDRHRAEELVQATLVRTYVAWPRARAGDPLAYARRTLANARIDTWRRRRREVLVDDTPERGPGHAGPEQGHAERDRLVRALATLSPQRRRVVVLRYVLDLSEQQVADDLGVSVGSVKSAASRGLRQLREALAAADGEEG